MTELVEFLRQQNAATRAAAEQLDGFMDWPGWVRAQCDAVDQVIELHDEEREHQCPLPDGGSAYFGYGHGWAEEAENPQRCPTLRLLAYPYRAHPEWREEWAP